MAVIQPDRFSAEEMKQAGINYTSIPNALIHCAEMGLSPSAAMLMLFFMSLPNDKPWTIHNTQIAKQLGIGKTTVDKYMTALKNAGLLDFTKNSKGYTKWVVTLRSAFKSVIKKPAVEKPQLVKRAVLETNKETEININTTNAVVVSLPDYVNQPVAKQALSKLEATQQTLVLAVLTAAMTKGLIKSPVAYLLGLVKKASDGCLDASGIVDKVWVKPVDKRKQEFIKRNFDKLKQQLANVERINIAHATYDGWIYAKDLEEFESGRS